MDNSNPKPGYRPTEFLVFEGWYDDEKCGWICEKPRDRRAWFGAKRRIGEQVSYYFEGKKVLVWAMFVNDWFPVPDKDEAFELVSRYYRGDTKTVSIGKE